MRFFFVLIVALLAQLLTAQIGSAQRRLPPGPPGLPPAPSAPLAPARPELRSTRVSGIAFDSVAGRPLQGAMVQLVAADNLSHYGNTVSSDEKGQFAFDGVPDGNYNLGFFHAVLDSLGLEPPIRALKVAGQTTIEANVAIPSPERIRAAICGPQSKGNSAALVMGVVRNARDGAPIVGAKVVTSWLELTFTGGAVSKNTPRRFTSTKDNGWFGICNVPSPGAVELIAGFGADSTDYVELQVPANGFFRRDMYIGTARELPLPENAIKFDSATKTPKRLFAGDGQLSGTVTASDSKQPVTNAQIGIVDGPRTTTNERGEWTLRNIATGTRTLEVRAVGHYPDRRAVDVITDAPSVRVELTTLKAVLAEVKVTAERLGARNLIEFEERRKSSGLGRFLTAADIAKRNPLSASELFRNFPGVYYEGRDTSVVQMRGVFTDRCNPAIFVNGHMVQGGTSSSAVVSGMAAADIDMFVKPSEIVGVEVYQTGQVPGQFLVAMSGCGSIVFWTK